MPPAEGLDEAGAAAKFAESGRYFKSAHSLKAVLAVPRSPASEIALCAAEPEFGHDAMCSVIAPITGSPPAPSASGFT